MQKYYMSFMMLWFYELKKKLQILTLILCIRKAWMK